MNQLKKLQMRTEKCTACGMCVLECSLLSERNDGKAEVLSPGFVTESDLKKIENIIKLCPGSALYLEAEKHKDSKAALLELKGKIKEPLILNMPSKDAYSFNKKDYATPMMGSPKEHRYEYSSYDKAKSAGESEFRDRIYAQRIPLIQQVVIAYKHEKIVKFMKYEESSGNYKFETKKMLENKLRSYIAEINAYTNDSLKLGPDFLNFSTQGSILSKDKDILNYKIDGGWTNTVDAELEPASWFSPWVDVDDTTVYVKKKSWFSSSDDYEEKDMYCFKLKDAVEKLGLQILDECQNCIPELANSDIEWELKEYHKELEKEWKRKVDYLINEIDKKMGGISELLKLPEENNEQISSAFPQKINDEDYNEIKLNNSHNKINKRPEYEIPYYTIGITTPILEYGKIEKVKEIYNKQGFNANGIHKNGSRYDEDGFDTKGFNVSGIHKNGSRYDDYGFDVKGYDKSGFNKNQKYKYDVGGFDKDGIHKNGGIYDLDGYDKNGYDVHGIRRSR